MRRLRSIPGFLSAGTSTGRAEAAVAVEEEPVAGELEAPEPESRVHVTLSDAERARIVAEVDAWALEQRRYGHEPSAAEVAAENERRIREAEDLLGEIQAGVAEQYGRR